MQPVASQFSQQLEALKVLIVDDEATMRKVTRSLLQVIGVKTIYEANDGSSGRCSSTALLARLVSILAKPREMVKKGDYYGPAPRKMSSYKPETNPALADVVFI